MSFNKVQNPGGPFPGGLDRCRFSESLGWWLYAGGLAAAEIVVGYVDPVAGVLIHAGLLVVLLVHAAHAARRQRHLLYLVLTIAPLIRILSLAIPMVLISPSLTYLVTGLTVLVAAGPVVRVGGFTPGEIGLRWGFWPVQLLVGLSGIPVGIAEYYLLRSEPLVDALHWGEVLLPALVLLVCTGFVEEFVFRGMMFRAARRYASRWHALIYVNVVFAVLHITHLVPLDVFFVFLVGVYFTVVVVRTRSLFGVALAHGLANIMLYIVWPFFV